MNIEQQVCSLELAKRLKELGVKQESLFYWFRNIGLRFYPAQKETIKHFNLKYSTSAYTVAELGEMLPVKINEYDLFIKKFCYDNKVEWSIGYNGNHILCSCNTDTEANARAKMLIYLLENKLIEESK